MYLIGYDIGSSSIKAALVQIDSGRSIGLVQSPQSEMEIISHRAGWAEQHPESWWENICLATKKLLTITGVKPTAIKGIGIGYQMHGLVLVDHNREVLRPSIIWCDSRSVNIGKHAFNEIGKEKCLNHLLNSPGNFTASKLAWVKENEPEIYARIHKVMLPGDYIAMKLTGEILTTPSGLSEGVLWDFKKNDIADIVLDHYGIGKSLIPEFASNFSLQGRVTHAAAEATGLRQGIPITYRAGDQPNNALSLNVLNPGEVAATGGTSGVVYGVVDEVVYDQESRVNGFAHVNHSMEAPRIGVLLCINGAGIQYSWIKHQIVDNGISYDKMEELAKKIQPGSDGLRILPFGNGAERMLSNQDIGAKINNLQFNQHTRAHLVRASLEGIAFSFVYGMHILQKMGLDVNVIRVGNDNLFQSSVFSQTISDLMESRIEMMETTGAIGAAKASGVELGFYSTIVEATSGLKPLVVYEPKNNCSSIHDCYQDWLKDLDKELKK